MKYFEKFVKNCEDNQKQCGGRKNPLEPGSKKNKNLIMIIVICVLALALIIAATVLIVRRNSSKDSLQDEKIAEMMEQVFKAANKYEDSSGFIDPEDCEAAINAVYEAACSNKAVVNCEKDEYGVHIEVKTGPDYVYCPMIEGLDTGGGEVEIVTVQPYYTENVKLNGRLDHNGLDTAAANLEAADSRFGFDIRNSSTDDDVNDSEVTMERILSLDDYGVILWQGHGGYTRSAGYFLCTNITYDKNFRKNYGNLNKDDLYIYDENKVGLKPSFFQSNFEDDAFDNAFVYFGTCYSGKDSKLTEVFLDKGAAVVFSNSRAISRSYNLNMIHFITESFFCGTTTETVSSAIKSLGYSVSLEPRQTWDIETSLELAKTIYGRRDPDSIYRAEVNCSLQPGVKQLTYSDWIEGFNYEAVPDFVDYRELFADDIVWSGEKTFVEWGGDSTECFNVSYRCPQLDTSMGDFEYVNSLIYDEYCRSLENNEFIYGDYTDGQVLFDYKAGWRDDVVSILLVIIGHHDVVNYSVYNVKISTGELLSDEEFLRVIDCSDFSSRLETAAGQKALNDADVLGVPQDQITDLYNSTIAEDNLSQAQPFINGDRLSAICPIATWAGKGWYNYLIDLE